MKYIAFLSALVFPFFVSAQVVQKQMSVVCMPTDHFRNAMKNHHETPVVLGVTSAGRLFEVWSSRDGNTWTAAISDGPSKMTCAVADGEGLENKPRDGM